MVGWIPHEAERVDDKDSALQLPYAFLLHGHLTAVHVQRLPVQLRQEQGSPSTGGRGASHGGTLQLLHGLHSYPRDQPNTRAILLPLVLPVLLRTSGVYRCWTSPLAHKVIFHQGSQPQGLCGVSGRPPFYPPSLPHSLRLSLFLPPPHSYTSFLFLLAHQLFSICVSSSHESCHVKRGRSSSH